MHTRIDDVFERIRMLEATRQAYDGSRSFGLTDDGDRAVREEIDGEIATKRDELERLERPENANEAYNASAKPTLTPELWEFRRQHARRG